MTPVIAALLAIAVTEFPERAATARVARDAAGNVYLSSTSRLLKLAPNARDVIWSRTYDGTAFGIATDAAGSVYLAGATDRRGFVMKLDPQGRAAYTTPIAGPESINVSAIAVNAAGEAFVTGSTYNGRLQPTPGAVSAGDGQPFVVKLTAAGTITFVATGVGGSSIALDPQENIYVAGSTSSTDYPTTPGAFQPSFTVTYCGSGFLGFPCTHQYVTKLDRAGTKILYSTFVSGDHAETHSGLAVDAEGNVYLTGTTSSRKYPVTPGAFQPELRSQLGVSVKGAVLYANAYVTKLNPAGTALVYSTYLGGAGVDSASAIAVEPGGSVVVGGSTSSSDFPAGFLPQRCRPADQPAGGSVTVSPYPGRVIQGFLTRLNRDGTAIAASAIVPGNELRVESLALAPDGAVIAAGGVGSQSVSIIGLPPPPPHRVFTAVGRIDASGGPQVACTTDAADYAPAGPVVPGQLLTLFGAGLTGARVLFDGMPAPLLYVSESQINTIVPYEVAGRSATTIDIEIAAERIHSRSFTLAEAAPSAFIAPDAVFFTEACSAGGFNTIVTGRWAVLNEDWAWNRCASKGRPGSVITVFLNGVGALPGAAPTGAINSARSPELSVEFAFRVPEGARIEYAGPAIDQVSGVWQVNIQTPQTNLFVFSLNVRGILVRQPQFFAWLE